jgi:uncharacterized protein YicC (UPF0701 family)
MPTCSNASVFDTQIRSVLPLAAPLSGQRHPALAGIFGDESVDVETAVPACLTLAGEALDDFTASRAREGEKLAVVILEKVGRMRALVREVEPRIPVAQASFNESSGSACWTPCNGRR